VVLEHIVVLLVDLDPGLVYVLLLIVELEIMIPSWAIFDILAHLIYDLAWERYVVLV
jgi:hypothetical protein